MRLLPLAAALSLALTTAARTAPGPAPDFSADRFKAHVAFLADDLLEGRDTGSRGHEIAAAYVATQLMALGLKPGGANGSWYQEVPFRAAVLDGKPRFTLTGAGAPLVWENGSEMVTGASLEAEKDDLSAPLVFAGYGAEAPQFGIDDYKGLDVKGRIVAVFAGLPKGLPSEVAAHLGDTKDQVAARHGAVGLVTLYTAAQAKRRPFAAVAARAARGGPGRPTLDWVRKDGGPGAGGTRFTATASDTAAAALFAGARHSFADLRAATDRGEAPKGFALKTRLRLERQSRWSTIRSPEVIGLLPGADPQLRDEYVILMGHLDHLGMGRNGKPGEDLIYNGALDNAAGVATMLETARAFAAAPEKPRRSILFIANTGEEKGLLGSGYFAANPTVPVGRIAAAVDLDMPLLLYRFTDVIAFGADHSTVGEAVRKAAGEMGVKLSPDPMPEENIFVRSDHYEFVKQGVPAIMLATGWANGGGEKWKAFLGGAYHHPNDDLSQPIDWVSGARFARINYLIARQLADAPQRPLWYDGDYFGDAFAPGQPRAARAAAR
jgi:Zn-dependent M28 family amino/carboxypeptidase